MFRLMHMFLDIPCNYSLVKLSHYKTVLTFRAPRISVQSADIKVVMSTAFAPPPKRYHWYPFLLEAESIPEP